MLITHADGSRVSIAIILVCDSVCDFVCLSVCTIKPKKAGIIIAKLGTGIVHHDNFLLLTATVLKCTEIVTYRVLLR